MNNIGTFGLLGYMVASRTMPIGFPIRAFADDADSIQVHEVANGTVVLDLNGKVIRWTVANPVTVSIAVVPNSPEDEILAVIYNANRVSQTVRPANDSINFVLRFPNGGVRTFTQGRIVGGPSAPTATADARLIGNVYTFAFGDQYSLTIASAINAVVGQLGIGDSVANLFG